MQIHWLIQSYLFKEETGGQKTKLTEKRMNQSFYCKVSSIFIKNDLMNRSSSYQDTTRRNLKSHLNIFWTSSVKMSVVLVETHAHLQSLESYNN